MQLQSSCKTLYKSNIKKRAENDVNFSNGKMKVKNVCGYNIYIYKIKYIYI